MGLEMKAGIIYNDNGRDFEFKNIFTSTTA